MSTTAPTFPPIARSATGTPAAPYIDFETALAVRRLATGRDDLPRYLLAPEIAVLLAGCTDLRKRMLFEFLWNTGARINEALAVTPADIELDGVRPLVTLTTLKQQRLTKAGRPPKGHRRTLPLLDAEFVRRLRDHLHTFTRYRTKPVWAITDDTARNWLRDTVAVCTRQGIRFSIGPISPHTFRHSYAMHLLYCGAAPLTLQDYLGHKDFKSTQVYVRIRALEVGIGNGYQVRFGMHPDEAAALLRRAGQIL